MKAGIWGTGSIAAAHAAAMAACGVVPAVAVNHRLEGARRFAKKWGVAVFADDPGALLAPDIEAVHVCAPPAPHFEMVRTLILHGKHVLCEKPLAITAGEAFELARLAEESGLVCAVNFNVRYHAACAEAHRLVQSPEFGGTALLHGSYLQEFHALPAPWGWRYEEETAGPMRAVTEIGSHWVDLARYVTGLGVTRVSAVFRTQRPRRAMDGSGMMWPLEDLAAWEGLAEDGVDGLAGGAGSGGNAGEGKDTGGGADGRVVTVTSEDSALLTLEFDGGVPAAVVLSEVAHGRENRLALEVTGGSRSLWWDSEDLTALHTAAKGTGVNTRRFAFGDGGFEASFRALCADFYAAVRAGRMPQGGALPTFRQAAGVVAVCQAVLQSAQNDAAWVDVAIG